MSYDRGRLMQPPSPARLRAQTRALDRMQREAHASPERPELLNNLSQCCAAHFMAVRLAAAAAGKEFAA
jgi:hypothetical protein